MRAYDRNAARCIREEDLEDPLAEVDEKPRPRARIRMRDFNLDDDYEHLVDVGRRLRGRVDAVLYEVFIDALQGRVSLPRNADATVDLLLARVFDKTIRFWDQPPTQPQRKKEPPP